MRRRSEASEGGGKLRRRCCRTASPCRSLSVQAHIDTRIALIMTRKTGMATTTETQLFVSSLTTVYPELRIVVIVLFAVYDVLSSEGQRLSGHSGVPQLIWTSLHEHWIH